MQEKGTCPSLFFPWKQNYKFHIWKVTSLYQVARRCLYHQGEGYINKSVISSQFTSQFTLTLSPFVSSIPHKYVSLPKMDWNFLLWPLLQVFSLLWGLSSNTCKKSINLYAFLLLICLRQFNLHSQGSSESWFLFFIKKFFKLMCICCTILYKL